MKTWLPIALVMILVAGCDDSNGVDDGGVDADNSTDGDADGDADGDSDADGDMGDDADVDGDVEEIIDQDLLPPQPADQVGPYKIGVTTVELADDSREDRYLPVEIWYPASFAEGAPVEVYELEANGLSLAQVDSPLGAVRDARYNAKLGRRPFILFSHGNGGVRQQSIFLTEYLAAHGFIVAAPDHTGNTMGDLMSGDVGRPEMAVSGMHRPLDLSFMLDELLDHTEERIPLLAGAIDNESVGVTGHSFGGYTALAIAGAAVNLAAARESCAVDPDELYCYFLDSFDPELDFHSYRDERVSVSVPLSPGGYEIFGAEGMAQTAIPTMIQAGSRDETTPLGREQEPMFENLGSPGVLAIIEDAGHFTFSDICILVEIYGVETLEGFGASFLTDGCNETNIDIEVGHQIINTLATAYFQIYLQDYEEAWDLVVAGPDLELRRAE
jgi:predicted dienelactone hydrolase